MPRSIDRSSRPGDGWAPSQSFFKYVFISPIDSEERGERKRSWLLSSRIEGDGSQSSRGGEHGKRARKEKRRNERVGKQGTGTRGSAISELRDSPSGDMLPLLSFELFSWCVSTKFGLFSLQLQLAKTERRHARDKNAAQPWSCEQASASERFGCLALRARGGINLFRFRTVGVS